MKITSFLKLCVLFVFLLMGSANGWASYKLVKVTSIQAGKKYVFERNGCVLNNSIVSTVLQTTSKYKSVELTGYESYVWRVDAATDGFYIKNVDKDKYLYNSSSTSLSFDSKASVWSFSFDNGVALIQNKSNGNRFIGEKKSNDYSVYTYEDSYLNTCPHDFTVYVLEDEIDSGVAFHETFDLVDNYDTSSFDQTGWTMSGDIYPVDKYGSVRLAKENGAGSITTPVLSAMTTDAIMTINVKGWDSDEKTLSVFGENCTVTPSVLDDIPSTYTNYTLKITDVGENPRITFSAASGCRIIIDDVKIMTHVGLKLAASGYATYCSPFALDLTPTDDYAAYAVSSVSGAIVNFAKIQGRVAPQTPIVLYNPEKAGQTILLPIATDGETLASNLLRGTLVPTPITTVDGDYTNFGLSGGKFVRINDGTIKANKAYLPLLTSSLPSTSNARLSVTFVDEPAEVNKTNETTGIRAAVASPSCDELYNLHGRRVVRPGKGLYIMRHASENQQGKTVKVMIK